MFVIIKLKSIESPYFYVKKKNKKNLKKIKLLKFDPLLNKKVFFIEEKI